MKIKKLLAIVLEERDLSTPLYWNKIRPHDYTQFALFTKKVGGVKSFTQETINGLFQQYLISLGVEPARANEAIEKLFKQGSYIKYTGSSLEGYCKTIEDHFLPLKGQETEKEEAVKISYELRKKIAETAFCAPVIAIPGKGNGCYVQATDTWYRPTKSKATVIELGFNPLGKFIYIHPDKLKYIDGSEISLGQMVFFSKANKKQRSSTLGATVKNIVGYKEAITHHHFCSSNSYVLSKDSWDEFLK